MSEFAIPARSRIAEGKLGFNMLSLFHQASIPEHPG
jgi:hypothetical protein